MTINTYRILDPLQVETKSAWADSWTVRQNVEPISGSAAAGSFGQFQFRVRYGTLKHPADSTFSNQAYTSIQRDWIRVKRSPYTDSDILFMGRVESDSRQVFGPRGGVPTGIQVFTAYDGTHLLAKRFICQSIVDKNGTFEVHDLLLPFNKDRHARQYLGNRSAAPRTTGGITHYVFERENQDEWTVADAIKYLIAEFIGGSGNVAIEPVWQVTIPSGGLTDKVEPMDFPNRMSLLDAIQSLVGRQYGWTWTVVPTATGFNLKFSTVTASAVTFETASVPANPDVLTVSTSDPDASIQLERTQVQAFGRIRVIGRPMVVCASFSDADLDIEEFTEDGEVIERRLILKDIWTSSFTGQHVPLVNEDGTVDTTTFGVMPATSRTCLEWMPIEAGYDYVLNTPPTDPDFSLFMSPFMVSTPSAAPGEYVYYHTAASASLYNLPSEIGLSLRDFNESALIFSNYNHTITVAFEAAHRLQCVHEISGAKDSDGEFVIEVPDAELWWLAKDTVIGLNSDGSRRILTTGKELRNDKDKIYRVMAGCIARYVNARSKASITFKGLYPYHQDIGKILGTVADSTDANTISAPITGVQWQFEGDFTTTVRTGFSE